MVFEVGKSGNKNGRPRTSELSIEELLRKRVGSPRVKALIVRKLIEIATTNKADPTMNLNLKAITLVMDRISGKPGTQPAKPGDKNIEVTYADADPA